MSDTPSPEGQNEQAALVVTQADREAAVALNRQIASWQDGMWDAAYLSGKRDGYYLVQAFARHRLEALASPQPAPDQQGAPLGDARDERSWIEPYCAWMREVESVVGNSCSPETGFSAGWRAAAKRLTTAPQPQGWQSMDSAPRQIEFRCLLAHRFSVVTGYRDGEEWRNERSVARSKFTPTHWMPLPAAPTPEQSA